MIPQDAPHEDAQTAAEATGDTETPAGTEGGRDDLRALLALKAAAFRWTASRRPTDGSLLADAARGLLVENERLREERDQAIAHDRQPYPTQWAYDQACAALKKQRERANAVRALANAATRTECGAGWDLDPAAVLAALDQPGESQ